MHASPQTPKTTKKLPKNTSFSMEAAKAGSKRGRDSKGSGKKGWKKARKGWKGAPAGDSASIRGHAGFLVTCDISESHMACRNVMEAIETLASERPDLAPLPAPTEEAKEEKTGSFEAELKAEVAMTRRLVRLKPPMMRGIEFVVTRRDEPHNDWDVVSLAALVLTGREKETEGARERPPEFSRFVHRLVPLQRIVRADIAVIVDTIRSLGKGKLDEQSRPRKWSLSLSIRGCSDLKKPDVESAIEDSIPPRHPTVEIPDTWSEATASLHPRWIVLVDISTNTAGISLVPAWLFRDTDNFRNHDRSSRSTAAPREAPKE